MGEFAEIAGSPFGHNDGIMQRSSPHKRTREDRTRPMELAATKFVKIDGTKVTVAVNSAEEARVAIKEIKHKKREVAHLRRVLARKRKIAQARALRAARARPRARKRPGWLSWVGSGLMALLARPLVQAARAKPVLDLPTIERDCVALEELGHSLDACMLQLEGRLIHEPGA